jgi:hypothetical protein
MALRRKQSDADGGVKTPRAGGRGDAPGRLAQLRMVWAMTRKQDPNARWITLAALVVPLAALVLVGVFSGPLWLWIPLGLLLGLLTATNVFSRRVQRSAYAEMEGKPGVAAGIVERMRGEWRVTAAVQVNRNQDVVHRVVGRPGIILIAEGRGRGPRDLLANEVRRIKRVAGDTPIRDVVVGNGEGEIPLPKLQSTLTRMTPRVLRKQEIAAVEARLRAVRGPAIPIPKGPIPKNIPRGGKIR